MATTKSDGTGPAAARAKRSAPMRARTVKTAAKPAGTVGAKPAAKAAARPKPKVVAKAAVAAVAASSDAKGATLRKKELIERVAKAAGAKKKDAREIVEATLTVLGEALAAGETLALPPFGKARVNRHRDVAGGGEMLTVKLRRSGPARDGAPADEPLAEPAE